MADPVGGKKITLADLGVPPPDYAQIAQRPSPTGSLQTGGAATEETFGHVGVGPTKALSAPGGVSEERRENRQKAFATYNASMSRIFGGSSKNLALLARDGKMPPTGDQELSPEQRQQVLESMGELFLDMPVGDLSPTAANWLERRVGRSRHGKAYEDSRVRDTVKNPAQLAKEWAADFKESSPTTYEALKILGYAGALGVSYAGGSKIMRKLGVKPEVTANMFDNKLVAKLEADWDAKFTNLSTRSAVSYTRTYGDTEVKTTLGAVTGPKDGVQNAIKETSQEVGVRRGKSSFQVRHTAAGKDSQTRVDAGYGDERNWGGAGVDLDDQQELERVRLATSNRVAEGTQLGNNVSARPDGSIEKVGASINHIRHGLDAKGRKVEQRKLNLGVEHNLESRKTTGSVSYEQKFKAPILNVPADYAIEGSSDGDDHKFGLGLRFSF